MRVSLVLVTALAVGLLAAPAWTKSGGAHGSYPSGTQAHAPAAVVARDSHGHIARNGCVVDHVQALRHGGADDPSNMQWQTLGDAKDKDKWE